MSFKSRFVVETFSTNETFKSGLLSAFILFVLIKTLLSLIRSSTITAPEAIFYLKTIFYLYYKIGEK